MANQDNLKPFSANNPPPGQGRPPGSRNRSTIARKMLELAIQVPDNSLTSLKSYFPELPEVLSAEDLSTLMQIMRSITKQDTNAYRAVMDSAYGAPKQELEHSGPEGGPITFFELPKKQ